MVVRALVCASLVATAAPAAAAPKRELLAQRTPAPAPPAIAMGARTFVAFAGQPAPVKLAWPPAANVARYRVRWTDAGALIDIELPGSATTFERSVATPGRHHLSVVAIDAIGRESPPTEIDVDVVAVTALVTGSRGDGETALAAHHRAFAIGARFASPGLLCQLGRGDRGDEVVATDPGATTLRCGGDPGQPRIEIPIVIAPVVVDGPKTPLVRGRTTPVHVTVASVASIGAGLEVETIGDVDLGDVQRTEHGLDVDVTARGATAALAIKSGGVALGRIELELVDGPPARPAAARLDWFAVEAGGYAGVIVPPDLGDDGTWLGRPANPMHAITSVPLAGGRVALFPTPRAGVEVEAALGMSGYVGQPGLAAVLVTRAQLAVRVVEEQRLGLRLLAGGDLFGILTERGTSHRDAAGAAHYGAAFTIETRKDVWLRFEALHVVTTARDAGFAHCIELQLGVMTRVGRRDHW